MSFDPRPALAHAASSVVLTAPDGRPVTAEHLLFRLRDITVSELYALSVLALAAEQQGLKEHVGSLFLALARRAVRKMWIEKNSDAALLQAVFDTGCKHLLARGPEGLVEIHAHDELGRPIMSVFYNRIVVEERSA